MITVQQIDVAELPRLVAIHNAVRVDDPATVDEIVDWRRQAEDMVWLLVTDDAADIGAGLGLVGWHSRPGVATALAWIAPEARRRGAGQALYDELLRWAGERGCVEVETSVAEDDPDSLAWADRRGFREIGRELKVSLDLTAIEAPTVEPPAGIEIVTWAERPDLAPGMYEVFVEADPDIPGSDGVEIPAFADWLSKDMQGLADRPQAVFVALAGDEVVGYAKLALSPARADVAWHDLTGVKRAWRGRGIASALKRAQIRWAKEQGYRRLTTMNDERNAPIRRLNLRHGYAPEPGRVMLSTTITGID